MEKIKGITQDEAKFKFAKQALLVAMFPASVMAIYEFAASALHFEMGMNVFDMAQYATNRAVPYNLALILVLSIVFPIVYFLYKERGINFKEAIYDKKTLTRDIGLGILGGCISFTLGGGWYFLTSSQVRIPANLPEVPFNGLNFALQIIALAFFSAFVKELIFRGFAVHMGKEVFGEFPAFLLFNIIFAILDWMNLGASFIAGTVWFLCFRKSNKLITPIIAHGFDNLLSVIIGVLVLKIL